MVFDTGPSFRSGSDTGALVLVPFLRGKGIRNVDLLVVSHGDNDHAGGVQSLLEETGVQTLIAGENLPDCKSNKACVRRGRFLTGMES